VHDGDPTSAIRPCGHARDTEKGVAAGDEAHEQDVPAVLERISGEGRLEVVSGVAGEPSMSSIGVLVPRSNDELARSREEPNEEVPRSKDVPWLEMAEIVCCCRRRARVAVNFLCAAGHPSAWAQSPCIMLSIHGNIT
jgi:hypothetical protein